MWLELWHVYTHVELIWYFIFIQLEYTEYVRRDLDAVYKNKPVVAPEELLYLVWE